MKDALDVHRSLLGREVPHEIVRLPRLVLSADEIPDALALDAGRCVATRIYQTDTGLAAVLVRSGDLPHPGAVLAALGARSVRFAPPDVVNQSTEFAAELVCPVLLPPEMPVIADACVGQHDVVYTATGDGGTALGIPSRWLLTAAGASVAELCTPGAPTVDLAGDLDGVIELPSAQLARWR
jgi:prolyl-tRNA editing enzyme YbaK/EbsC (Cys-tRNA(Pro) deacylase)